MSLSAATTAWGLNTNAFVPPIPTRQQHHGNRGPAVWNRVPIGDLSARPWTLPQESAKTAACGGNRTSKRYGLNTGGLRMQAGGKDGDDGKPKGSRMLQGPNLELMK